MQHTEPQVQCLLAPDQLTNELLLLAGFDVLPPVGFVGGEG